MKRRQFIQYSGALIGIGLLNKACKKPNKIKASFVSGSSKIGHILREKKIFTPIQKIQLDTIIVGGGVSGLSAARWLYNNGHKNFLVFDLDERIGGNAQHSENHISKYPLGAHYVPIANNDLKEYIDFLVETNSIIDFDNNLPIYNEEHLCNVPTERLYINGVWQDGLIPHFGLSQIDKDQIQLFLKLMQQYKLAKGKDGKDAFSIPVNSSSSDIEFLQLDELTMYQWLQQKKIMSSYLHNYINYCCKDDYGTDYKEISAWMGIHYFASRKGKALNAQSSDVLTWCEGNGFLVHHLIKSIQAKIQLNKLVTNILIKDNNVQVTVLNTLNNECILYTSKQCILATPQFVSKKLLPFANERNIIIDKWFHYTPWLVANLVVENVKDKSGASLCWDNVIHSSKSLGYVVSNHQKVNQYKPQHNFTYYLPLIGINTKKIRQEAYTKSIEEWQEIVFKDLEVVHSNIREATSVFEVKIWGHSMAKPIPGFISKRYRDVLQNSFLNKIHFANTDIAGNSIFEEAFYQGIEAAKKVLNYA